MYIYTLVAFAGIVGVGTACSFYAAKRYTKACVKEAILADVIPDSAPDESQHRELVYSPLDQKGRGGPGDEEFGELRGTILPKTLTLIFKAAVCCILAVVAIVQYRIYFPGPRVQVLLGSLLILAVLGGLSVYFYLLTSCRIVLYEKGFSVKSIRGIKRFPYNEIVEMQRHKQFRNASYVQQTDWFARLIAKILAVTVWSVVFKSIPPIELKSNRFAKLDKSMERLKTSLILRRS